MDPRLLRYYDRELRHLREMGAEFAERFPKIADRLGLQDTQRAQDPYVEQLLQGFAFLAARVQLKVDSQFPRFSQHLLESVYPDYLAPTPSMTVVQLHPDPGQGDLKDGPLVPQNTVLQTELGKGERTVCEYRTAHPLRLWPLEVAEAQYLPTTAAVAALGGPALPPGTRSGLRLRLQLTSAEIGFADLPLEQLALFLGGSDTVPFRLYEALLGHGLGLRILPAERPAPWCETLGAEAIQRLGFAEDEALLPYSPRSFQGYRLLREYFTLPQRFLFVALEGIGAGLRRCRDRAVDILVPLDRFDEALADAVQAENFLLHCTPAINLFPRRLDRVRLHGEKAEHHAVLDRTRGMDFEIYRITEVVGHRTGNRPPQRFHPFYAGADTDVPCQYDAYYTVHRQPRLPSQRQRQEGLRSADGFEDLGYIGSEVFVALVDAREAPYAGDIQELAISALCTNRDLPLLWRRNVGRGRTDFILQENHPVDTVRCVVPPSDPRPAHADREVAWRLINHLSLNYLSLVDNDAEHGAAALRDLLSLYAHLGDAASRQQVDGLRSVRVEHVTRRIPVPGPIAFGRGRQVSLAFDENAFTGVSVFLFGGVMEQFLARYASVNTFTQTVVRTADKEVMTWPLRMGLRDIL